MKSSNPHSGFHEETITKTLDTNPDPTCNQGGNVIVQKVCYSIEGNTVDRTSNKNGKGYCEDVSPTLNTQDKHAVTYAIEGNGQRESHQWDGYAETDKMYTLNTIERHAVVFEPKSALEENWSESKVKNALRAEASKSSHVVCFQQNQRDEVRNQGGHSLNYINPIVYDARGNGGVRPFRPSREIIKTE